MKWLNGYRMRLVLVGCVTVVFNSIGFANGATITVGPGEGYDFGTIQAGIDAANDGDTVLVVSGEYVVTEPITFRGKAITVKTEAGPDETTIRMGTPTDSERASVVIFENNETATSVLEGFTITGGRGCWVAEAEGLVGGGIYFPFSSATVKNCTIVHNSAGGVLCEFQSSPTLIDCIIAENVNEGVNGNGGGVMAVVGASLTLTKCIISGNSTRYQAGGVGCWSNSAVTLSDCIIAQTTTGLSGGGMMTWDNCNVTMNNCIVTDNAASAVGGGMQFANSRVKVTNCVIARNTSGSGGGGVGCAGANSSVNIENCTFCVNSSGSQFPAHVGGGGVHCDDDGSAEIANSIIWANTSPNGDQIAVTQGASTLTVAYSNVSGGQTKAHVDSGCTLNWGEGNIDADPYFANIDNNDFHLKSQAGRWNPDSQTWIQDDVTSACIDLGNPMSPIDWEFFPNGGFINMGAYGGTPEASKAYFGEPVCETIVAGDINGDGQVNRTDLEIMALHWTDEEPLPLP